MTEPTYEPMEHEEKLAWMLETHGWGIEPVAPSDQKDLRPAYSYTFGLEALVGHPEIVIFLRVADAPVVDAVLHHKRSRS